MSHPDLFVRAAAKREVVKLADGRTARLLSWPYVGADGVRSRRSNGGRARVELPSGKILSVPKEQVSL